MCTCGETGPRGEHTIASQERPRRHLSQRAGTPSKLRSMTSKLGPEAQPPSSPPWLRRRRLLRGPDRCGGARQSRRSREHLERRRTRRRRRLWTLPCLAGRDRDRGGVRQANRDAPFVDANTLSQASANDDVEHRAQIFDLAVGHTHDDPSSVRSLLHSKVERAVAQIDSLRLAFRARGPSRAAFGGRIHGRLGHDGW